MGGLLLAATLFAYSPAIRGGLLWDDDSHVTRPDLQSFHGLWRIWFEPGATQQYYPVLHTAFWLEHWLWAENTFYYHLVNILLHAFSACLLIFILRYLRVPGSWLAGLLFALHPVAVETVAWISEQKNTLSAVFFFSSALLYLIFDGSRRRKYYALAFSLFVLALLSKTVTATLPAALLVLFWWRRGTLGWRRDVVPLLPWFMSGVVAGEVTEYVERHFIGAQGADFILTLGQRCLLASRAVCFYFGKLIWPVGLSFVYPRWSLDSAGWWQFVYPVTVLGLFGAFAWLAFRRRQRTPLACGLLFVGVLFPALGFWDVYPFVYSYVADHFQYLAMVVVLAAAAAVLTRGWERLPVARGQGVSAGILLAGVLFVLTWRQAGAYTSAPALYRATLARNPDCWLAHNNLGNELLEMPGELDKAILHLETAMRLAPDHAQTYNSLGLAVSRIPGRQTEALGYFEMAVRLQPNFAQAQNNLGLALSAVPGRLPEAVSHLEAALRVAPEYAEAHDNLGTAFSRIPGRLNDAIEEFRTAVRLDPAFAAAHYNLANALTDLPGGLPEAISEYEETLRLDPRNAEAHNNLGIALSAIGGRLPEAVAQYQNALQIRPGYAEAHYNLGLALSKTPGKSSEAFSEFEEALKNNAGFEPARRMIDRLKTVSAPAATR